MYQDVNDKHGPRNASEKKTTLRLPSDSREFVELFLDID